MYLLLITLIYLAFISIGLPDSLLGSGWPVIHTAVGVPVSWLGFVSMVISGGTIVMSLMSDSLTRRFGTRTVTVASVFLTALAMLGFSVSSRFWMLLVFAIPYGLGAGAIDAALNNYVALHYSSKHMSWLHCFWGVGAIISPYIMSNAIVNSEWNDGYRIVGFLQLAIGLILLIALRPQESKHTLGESDRNGNLGLVEALKIKGVAPILCGFFAYCAAEATTMGWASTYLVMVRGVVPEIAARFASLFYIGITAGRFLGGFIMNKLGDRRMIHLGACVLTSGIVLVALPVGGGLSSIIGFVVIGLGCAPIYPCIIHSTPANFGAENSGAIIGIQMASAYVGSTFIPPLFGALGSLLGFSVLPIFLSVFLVLMLFMTEKTFRITAKKAQ